jgi:hypothetical protein
LVSSGAYSLVVELDDVFGNHETWSASLTVLRAESGAVVEVYNSAGELVWHTQAALQSAGALALSGHELVPAAGGAGLKISYGSGSADYVMWDGKGSNGQALSNGNYVVKVTQSGSNGKTTYADSVALLQPNTDVFSWVAAAPNPVRSGTNSVMLSLQGAAPGVSAWGEAYNLAGERVGSLSVDSSGVLRWDIRAGIASGVYLLRVTARDGQGRLKSVTVKVSVLR